MYYSIYQQSFWGYVNTAPRRLIYKPATGVYRMIIFSYLQGSVYLAGIRIARYLRPLPHNREGGV